MALVSDLLAVRRELFAALLARFRARRQREVGLRAHGRARDVLLGDAVHARRARRLAHPI